MRTTLAEAPVSGGLCLYTGYASPYFLTFKLVESCGNKLSLLSSSCLHVVILVLFTVNKNKWKYTKPIISEFSLTILNFLMRVCSWSTLTHLLRAVSWHTRCLNVMWILAPICGRNVVRPRAIYRLISSGTSPSEIDGRGYCPKHTRSSEAIRGSNSYLQLR